MLRLKKIEDEKLPPLTKLLSDFEELDHNIGVEKTKQQLVGRTLEQESYKKMDQIVN